MTAKEIDARMAIELYKAENEKVLTNDRRAFIVDMFKALIAAQKNEGLL